MKRAWQNLAHYLPLWRNRSSRSIRRQMFISEIFRHIGISYLLPLKTNNYKRMKRAWRKSSQKVMFEMRVLPIYIGITIEK